MKILYIEDDPAHVELTLRSLEIHGAKFDFEIAQSMQKAFALLDTMEFDVILSDYRLPDGSGLDVINNARERGIITAIVLITNQDDINIAVAALKAGAVDYLVKQSDYLLRLPIVLQNAHSQTQFEKQQLALRESENKYRNIFENAVEGIFQSSMDGRFIGVNPAMAKIYGYDSPEEMINSVGDISSQIYPRTESRQRFIEELITKGSVEKFEAQQLRKDGTMIWTSTNARVVKNKNGEILFFEGFLADITERKQAELYIEASEKKYRTLVERFPGVVFMEDFNNNRISRYTSPRIKDVLGYTPEEWATDDRLWENDIHPDDRERILAEDKRTDQTGEPFQVEYRIRRKDGNYIWIREDSYLIRDQAGNPDYWHGILFDITAQKAAQEAINANENSYRGLFNSVTQAIYIQDVDGRFIDVNDGAIKMYGYPREFFIGKSPLDISAPDKNNMEQLAKMSERAFAGEPQEFLFWGQRSNGQAFPKIVNLNNGTYFGQKVIIAVAQDITERKQAEEILERQLLELTILHATSLTGTQSNTEYEIIEQTIQITSGIFTEICGVLLLNEEEDMLFPHPSCIGPELINWQNCYPVTEGITGRAVQLGRAVRVGDITKEENYREIAPGIKSELCVPFWVNDRIIGVFDVESKRENAFDEKDERLLNTIAAGLGTAIEKLRLFKAEQAQRQREAAILNLIRVAASSLDLNQVLQSILDQLIKVIPSDSGTIQLLDGDHLNILAAIGTEAVGFAKRGPLMLAEFPLNNYVVTQKQTVRVDNTLVDDRYKPFDEDAKVRSFVGIPLIAKEKTIGMITLDSYQIAHFTEQDEELGLAIANHASIAIENARLFDAEQHRRRQAEILRKATEALTSSIELEKIFEIIFDSLDKLIAYDSSSIEILDHGYFKIVAGRNIAKSLIGEKYEAKLDKWGAIEEVRQAVIIADVQNDDRFEKLPGSEYIHSWMGIPLFSQDKVIGYINLDSRNIGFFNQEHAAIVQTFANQAAIAIENARLFQEESHRSRIIEALANIANEIATTRAVIPALDKIARRALSLLNARTIAVYLLQDDNKTVKIVTAQGAYQNEMLKHTIVIGEGITGNIIANGKAEIIDDMAQDSRKITVPGTPKEDAGLDTMMSAPLILHGISIGAINAWRLKSNGLFDKSELNFLVSIAQQASISIESARLFEETMRRAQEAAAIAEVGRDISATPQLDLVLDRIAFYAKELLQAQTSAVYLSQPDQDTLRAISAVGVDAEEIKNDPRQKGVGIVGNIALQKFGEIVNDTAGDPRAITIKGTDVDPDEHLMGVPVLSKGKLTGLLVVWRSGLNNEFKLSDLEFLSSLAQQAAVAIENARLFELEQQRRKEAETVMHATMALANLLDLPSLYTAILKWLHQIVPYDSASILEIEEDYLRLTATQGLPTPEKSARQTFPLDNELCNIINTSSEALIIGDCTIDPRFEKWGGTDYVRGWMGVPLISRGRAIGYITLDSRMPNAFVQNDAVVTQTFAQQAATAIENVRLYEAERKRRQEAENLRLAATAITSTLDPKKVLETILTALQQVVRFDSGTMMLLEDEYVRIVTAQGFDDNNAAVNRTFPANNKLLLAINQTQKPYILEDASKDPRFERWATDNPIRGWMGIPLIVHGRVIGYITLDSLKVGTFDNNAAILAQTFALQASAAIDNTQLFENLQKSNQELSLAYDTTLEGWGKALELRDKETHGHTQRVTDLTLKLARYIGLSKAELTHLHRGVLLHDIGKMGVRDEILHKNGPLTAEEWVEMRKHPQHAFDLLYPIAYLRASLDIPYSHHEWWDGTGYPQKLKGEEIPIAARIFAVVDVWDALLNERPYRKAWTKAKVIRYLRKQAGTHFDPNILEIFLKMMEEKSSKQPVHSRKKTPPKRNTIKGRKNSQTKKKA